MRTILVQVACGALCAVYRRDEETGIIELVLIPDGLQSGICRDDCAPEPLIQAKVVEDDYPFGFSQGRTMRESQTVLRMQFNYPVVRRADDGSVCVSTRIDDSRGWYYLHELTMSERSTSARITVSVINESDEPVTFEMLSSFTLGSLSPFSAGLDPGNLVLHRMRSTWSAEGRMVSIPVEDLQLEPSWQRFSANSIRFGSIGSFPVREWVPFAALEDVRAGVTWAVATTHASSWQIEVYRRDNGMCLSGGIADREFGHWMKTIHPRERFDAPYAVITAVHAGVDEASQAIASDVRRDMNLPQSERHMPVIFNEFCSTWGAPTEHSVIEQLDVVKSLGVECFVIDAGWFDDNAIESATRFGKWDVSDKAFPDGIKFVVDKIHASGLKAGIWFEFEVVGRDESECFNRTEWLLTRDGLPITSGNRRWWDMRNPKVQEYLAHKVIDFLKTNGFDYLKIDYNDSLGIGCDTPGDPQISLGQGLYDQIQASQAFFRRIRRVLPELTMEICASGGHRLVQSFMHIGSMASFSDAHECDSIPIIAGNMHRIIEPRQSQIWVVVRRDTSVEKLFYRICAGFLGRLCFSGDSEGFSGRKQAIIAQGIAFYRGITSVIDTGESRWFGPHISSYDRPEGWQAIVRSGHAETSAEGVTLVVVHTFDRSPAHIELPITGYIVNVFCREGLRIEVIGGVLSINDLHDFDGIAIMLWEKAEHDIRRLPSGFLKPATRPYLCEGDAE